jgi:ribokinase
MTPSRLIVVGSSNTDLIIRAPRLPGPGETVLGGDLTSAAGGKGANQAVAAARLGASVTFVGRVGSDVHGQQALNHLNREGLDTRFVVTDAAAPSGVAFIVVGPNGQNQITVAPGANLRLSTDDVHAALPAFEQASVLLLQLETPLETVLAAARLGRAHGLHVVLNPAPAQPLPEELYALIDVLTPNQHEATQLTGEPEPQRAAEVLLRRGCRCVVVTLGEAGVYLRDAQHSQQAPAHQVEAVDATAAGDAFNGALAVALTWQDALPHAVQFAQAAAALSVTRLGAQPSLPTLAEVQAWLAKSAG